MNTEQITEIKQPKKTDDMTFEELKAYTIRIKENKKKYIRKYQKTERGKTTTRVASQKYYVKKREEILAKKREFYKRKKALKTAKL